MSRILKQKIEAKARVKLLQSLFNDIFGMDAQTIYDYVLQKTREENMELEKYTGLCQEENKRRNDKYLEKKRGKK